MKRNTEIENKLYVKLQTFIFLNNCIVSLANILVFVFFAAKQATAPIHTLILYLLISFLFGFFAVWSQNKRGMMYIQNSDETSSLRQRKEIPVSNLAIVLTVALDSSLIGALHTPSIALLNVIMLNVYTLIVYSLVKFVPNMRKTMQKERLVFSTREAESIYYAVKFADWTLWYVVTAGVVFLMLFVVLAPKPGSSIGLLLSFYGTIKNVIILLIAVLIGIALGHLQSSIRFHEVISDTDRLAEIQKSQENFSGSIIQGFSFYTTRFFKCHLIIVLLLISIWIIILSRMRTINFAPLVCGFVYAFSDFLLWKLRFKRKITQTTGYKTYL